MKENAVISVKVDLKNEVIEVESSYDEPEDVMAEKIKALVAVFFPNRMPEEEHHE